MKPNATRTEPDNPETVRSPRYFVCCCPNLDLWAVGRTREDAERTIREEILLLVARCRDYLDGEEAVLGTKWETIAGRPC